MNFIWERLFAFSINNVTNCIANKYIANSMNKQSLYLCIKTFLN
jgi:hypothetical protein